MVSDQSDSLGWIRIDRKHTELASMFINGSVLFTEVRNRNVLLRFRFGRWKSFGSISGSGSRQYLAVFQKQKNYRNLAFSLSEAPYFPESWPLIVYILLFLLHLLLDPNPRQKVTVAAVPIPAPIQRYF
jgi:hypothetical protein